MSGTTWLIGGLAVGGAAWWFLLRSPRPAIPPSSPVQTGIAPSSSTFQKFCAPTVAAAGVAVGTAYGAPPPATAGIAAPAAALVCSYLPAVAQAALAAGKEIGHFAIDVGEHVGEIAATVGKDVGGFAAAVGRDVGGIGAAIGRGTAGVSSTIARAVAGESVTVAKNAWSGATWLGEETGNVAKDVAGGAAAVGGFVADVAGGAASGTVSVVKKLCFFC